MTTSRGARGSEHKKSLWGKSKGKGEMRSPTSFFFSRQAGRHTHSFGGFFCQRIRSVSLVDHSFCRCTPYYLWMLSSWCCGRSFYLYASEGSYIWGHQSHRRNIVIDFSCISLQIFNVFIFSSTLSPSPKSNVKSSQLQCCISLHASKNITLQHHIIHLFHRRTFSRCTLFLSWMFLCLSHLRPRASGAHRLDYNACKQLLHFSLPTN